jgi:hypothetical protein
VALIKKRLDIDAVITPGKRAGYPDLDGVVEQLERHLARDPTSCSGT